MPFTPPTLAAQISAIQADIKTRLPGSDPMLPRGVLPTLARVQAGGLDGLYGYIDWVARQIPYDTADEAYLRRYAAVWGIHPKLPAAATGSVTVTGAIRAVLPTTGTVLARADGVRYAVTSDLVLVAATGIATVACTSVGAITNCAAGTALTLVGSVEGIAASVTVGAAGLGGGADAEGPDSLRARLLARIQEPPMGGSRADYVRWARDVPGVTRAWVLPGWQGPGTVGLTFMMDGRAEPIPTAADVAVVAAHVEARRPVAATTYYFAPTPVPLDPVIRLSPDSLAARAAIKARLAIMLAKEAVPGGSIKVTQVHRAISAAHAVDDYRLLSLADNVTAPAGCIITLGTLSWD